MHYETVIGLEVHVQLDTASKIFCGDDSSFGAAPNTHISAISLAHPGTLPRLNRKAVESAVKLGLALGCRINQHTTFDRKNYFYPDSPKGYQITQDRQPICVGGSVKVGDRVVRIHHIHMEDDAGKSIHDQDPHDTLIDLNRAGVPLLEIVTEPDLRSAAETAAFMDEIRRLVRWVEVSDGNMEEGSMRCDVNISVRKTGAEKFGQRCEIKNVNSMRFARKAIEFEAERQIALLESGGVVEQQTRGFDPVTGTTYPQRDKEDAHDYRYFPEPDLPPVVITNARLDAIKTDMPALPSEMFAQFTTALQLSEYDANLLTQERTTAVWFKALTENVAPATAKNLANLVINKLLPWSASTETPLESCPVPSTAWISFIQLIESGKVSASAAYQHLFPALMAAPDSQPEALATNLQLIQSSDTGFLEDIINDVLNRFPDKVAEYKKGKKGLIGMFMGEIMKMAKGKAEPKATQKILEDKLK